MFNRIIGGFKKGVMQAILGGSNKRHTVIPDEQVIHTEVVSVVHRARVIKLTCVFHVTYSEKIGSVIEWDDWYPELDSEEGDWMEGAEEQLYNKPYVK